MLGVVVKLPRRVIMSLGVCLLLWTQSASGQSATGQPAKDSLGIRAKRAKAGGGVAGLRPIHEPKGTANSNRFRGVQTRIDRLRYVAPWMSDIGGLLPGPSLPASPIQRILDQRNLLRARSPLGRTGTAFLGRYPSVLETSAPPAAGPISEPAVVTTEPGAEKPPPVTFEDALANRLDKMAENNFEFGITYFRESDYPRARHYFDMARDVWHEKPRCYLALTLVAQEMGDTNQACIELMQALKMAKTLDDLRIDNFLDRFYAGDDLDKKRQALNGAVDQVNMKAQQMMKDTPAAAAWNLLLAYYSWLNGDLVTAVSAADKAARALPEGAAEPVARFRDMLVEEQRTAGTGATAQPAVK